MNAEFYTLHPDLQAAVRRVVNLSRSQGRDASEVQPDGGDVYAYPGARGTHWGHNRAGDGFCKARGIWPEGERA